MPHHDDSAHYEPWMRRNPPHPGRGIWHGCMDDGDGNCMSVEAAARKLGVPPERLARVLDGREGISPALALKLEAAGWSTARAWLYQQAEYDLVQERRRANQWPHQTEEQSAQLGALAGSTAI